MKSYKTVPLRRCPCCPNNNRQFDDHGLFQHAVATYQNNPNCATSRAHIGLIGELTERISESFKSQSVIFNPSVAGNGNVAMLAQFQGIGIPHNFGVNNSVPLLPKSKNESIAIPQYTKTKDVPQCLPKTPDQSLHPRACNSSQTKAFDSSQTKVSHPKTYDSSQTKAFDSSQTKVSDEEQDYDFEVVWPWMGILVNLHNSIDPQKTNDGKPIDESFKSDIKKKLSCLNAKTVHTHFSKSQLGGMSVLEFGTDVIGYFDAHDLHRKYFQLGRGKKKWLQVLSERKDPGKEPYGWIADKTDYHGNDLVGELLRKKGHLRSLQWKRVLDSNLNQLHKDMRIKLQEKNMKLMEYVTENCNLQRTLYHAENEKYTAETRAMSLEDMHKKEMERSKQLQTELTDIKKRCNDLGEKSKEDENNQQKIKDLMEDKELLQDCYQHVLYKERALNDEIQNAKKKAIEILEKLDGNGGGIIGIKRVGELDDKPWRKVCAEKFKYDEEGWLSCFTKLFSLWESYVQDGSWCPFKTANTSINKCKEQVDENDERLVKLREEYGNVVCKTVVNALNELQQYNASGRYSIRIPWNFQQEREATLEEILTHITNVSSKRRRM